MIEGKGSKTWDKAKQFAYTEPKLAHQLLQKITTITIDYLKAQTRAGADCVQVFDSWAGSLSPEDFKTFAQPYLTQIADAVKDDAPVILFPKGTWYALEDLSKSSASAIGLDWTVSPKQARAFTNNNITLQGNFDPAKLLVDPHAVELDQRFAYDPALSTFGVDTAPLVPKAVVPGPLPLVPTHTSEHSPMPRNWASSQSSRWAGLAPDRYAGSRGGRNSRKSSAFWNWRASGAVLPAGSLGRRRTARTVAGQTLR